MYSPPSSGGAAPEFRYGDRIFDRGPLWLFEIPQEKCCKLITIVIFCTLFKSSLMFFLQLCSKESTKLANHL
jgi:hypothetical protein